MATAAFDEGCFSSPCMFNSTQVHVKRVQLVFDYTVLFCYITSPTRLEAVHVEQAFFLPSHIFISAGFNEVCWRVDSTKYTFKYLLIILKIVNTTSTEH